MEEKARKKAAHLFVFWLACFFIFTISSNIYVSYQRVFLGNNPTLFLSSFQLLTLGIVVLYFLPLLSITLYYAKQSHFEKMQKIILIVLVLLLIWSFFMILCTLFAYVAPETFATIISMSE